MNCCIFPTYIQLMENKEFKAIENYKEQYIFGEDAVRLFLEEYRERMKGHFCLCYQFSSYNIGFVVMLSKEVVGIALGYELNQLPFILGIIEVSKNYRRKGIGTVLLSSIKKYCKNKNLPSIEAWCNVMKELHLFWKKNGFKIDQPWMKSLPIMEIPDQDPYPCANVVYFL